MERLLLGLIVLLAIADAAMLGLVSKAAGEAIFIAVPLMLVGVVLTSQAKPDNRFLIRLFIAGVLVRILVGALIYFLHLQEFFGGDANTYDQFGYALLKTWEGDKFYQYYVDRFVTGGAGSGWGMLYVVAVIYRIVGRNMLAIQFMNAVIGAATAPVAYLIATEIFPNKKVGRLCGLMTAFFPSLVLWTSQGLKDGLIIFLLALSILSTLKLERKFTARHLIILIVALSALITLRFYVFYIVVFSIACAFLLGRGEQSTQSFIRQFVIMCLIGGALAFFGVSRYATQQYDTYANFHQIQLMRQDASQSAASGFGQDLDVSTPSGALAAIPLGFCYLMLAPFPWQLVSLRQMITLPEMLCWWTMLPFLVLGLWFTLKHRLREVAPILIFTTLLTISYSIVQGNVGTAYRQRAQLLIFYFVFVAIGMVLVKERRDQRRKPPATPTEPRPREWATPERPSRKGQMPVPG
jgi:hypothetical protein